MTGLSFTNEKEKRYSASLFQDLWRLYRINYYFCSFPLSLRLWQAEQPEQLPQPQSQPPLPLSFLTICHTAIPITNAPAATINNISYHCILFVLPVGVVLLPVRGNRSLRRYRFGRHRLGKLRLPRVFLVPEHDPNDCRRQNRRPGCLRQNRRCEVHQSLHPGSRLRSHRFWAEREAGSRP